MMELDTFSCLSSINIIVFSLRADYTAHICSVEHHVHAFNSKIPKCWHVHVCGRMQYCVYLSVPLCTANLSSLLAMSSLRPIRCKYPHSCFSFRVMDCEYLLDFLRVYAHSSIRYYYLPFDRSPYDIECIPQYKQSDGEFRAHNG